MTIAVRSLFTPGVTLISAAAVALGPAVVAPPALTPAKPSVEIPAVEIQNIQLAGIGRAIYDGAVAPAIDAVNNAITNVVSIVPIAGDLIANQIDIAFGLFTDIVEPTVYYLSTLWSSLFKDIWAIPQWTGVYIWSLAAAPLNALASELEAFGLPAPDIPGPPIDFPPNDFPVYDLITGRRAPAPAATAGAASLTPASAKARSPRSAAASRGSAKAVTANAATAKPASARKTAKSARAAH